MFAPLSDDLTKFHYFVFGCVFDRRILQTIFMNDNHFKFSPQVILLPMFSVLLLWMVYWAEVRYGSLSDYGIYPREVTGLRGVVFSPFLHGSLEHLYNNSLALVVLLAALAYFYRELAWKIIVYGILLSGLITWMIGRSNYHIGASGLIYVLVSFIFFKGIMTKYYRLVALSLMVIMLYGSMAWYVFPDVDNSLSWEGHLAGLVAGFAFAVYFRTPEYKKMIRYDWERPDFDPSQDKFMQRFDENGNFVNPPPPETEEEPVAPDQHPVFTYRFIPKEKSGA